MMQNELEYYIDRLAEGNITDAEWKALQQTLKQPGNQQLLEGYLDRQLIQLAEDPIAYPDVTARVKKEINARIAKERGEKSRAPIRVLPIWWAAASLLFVLAIGGYYWVSRVNDARPSTTAFTEVEPNPASAGAILTLADGSQLVLDSLGNGVVAKQEGSQVIINNGQLLYEEGSNSSGRLAYNTLTAPKGRQFNLRLPDGSEAWLNAESSIRYPTAFRGKERLVEITGEVYFQVSPNAQMPFKVKVNRKAEIVVLGTSFNVNAYENEASITTTLLEGSIKINGHLLKPDQQARIANNGLTHNNVEIVDKADIDKVMAWKKGLFNFEDVTMLDFLRQVERWYDIEIIYEKGVPNLPIMGKMTRDVPLNGLLKNLEKLGLRYKLEGRILTVLP